MKQYTSLFQKWDLYIPFMELGIEHLCHDKGICAMIIPYPFTNQLYAKKMRKMLTENYNTIEITDLNGTKIFTNATVSNCILFVKKSPTIGISWISNISKDQLISKTFEQPHKQLIQNPNTFVWNLTQADRKTNRHENMPILGDICYISVGMVLNADEKKAKGEFVKKDLISNTFDEIHCKKYIEGKDLERYDLKRFRFLEWGTKRCPNELRRPTFPELYTTKKLLINALGALKASIDIHGEFYCEQQVRMALLWKDLKEITNKSITSSIKKFSTLTRDEMETLSESYDLRYLLGILNSKYAAILLTNIRGGDYHIVPEHIRNIPIPNASIEQQKTVIKLVDKILEIKSNNPQADTKDYEKEIDKLVYYLYGLSDDEVKVISSKQ